MSVFSAAELAGMRLTQESHMSHRAVFYPWRRTQDLDSGQMVNSYVADSETGCGVRFTPQAGTLEGTEGTVIANYQIRLPIAMLGRATALCRYEIVSAFGELLNPTWMLEQVGPPAPGPSGLLIYARRVAV